MIARPACVAYEVTVVGPLGPVLRAAFPEQHFAAIEACTVIRLRVPAERDLDLVDLVGLFESAGIVVQDLFRSSVPGQDGAVERRR
ncbi:hypothetical protein EV652_103407 [Kribbella steppae]|uniref:ACT domain-containing protein n=1 Tax=Kribbella steppae TaxID=2512223 RepID=A0A4R2HR66_9ACTN|nr:hypothetical protein [Kribbella steppae]TCO33406.1 hypothetical protein EV652_103407 [Kribbella steppae]